MENTNQLANIYVIRHIYAIFKQGLGLLVLLLMPQLLWLSDGARPKQKKKEKKRSVCIDLIFDSSLL